MSSCIPGRAKGGKDAVTKTAATLFTRAVPGGVEVVSQARGHVEVERTASPGDAVTT